MRKSLFALGALLLSQAGVAAEDGAGVLACAAFSDEPQRLACYDKLASELSPTVAVPLTGTGKWIVSENVNPVDDSKTVTVGLPAEEDTLSKYGEPILLVLRCQSNKTEALISWGEYLGSEVTVLTRVDSEDALTYPWSLSSNSQASFAPQPIPFIERLLTGKERLVAQTTPYNENVRTVIFPIAGLTEAIKPLRETCGW